MVESSESVNQNQILANLKLKFESLTPKMIYNVELDPDSVIT